MIFRFLHLHIDIVSGKARAFVRHKLEPVPATTDALATTQLRTYSLALVLCHGNPRAIYSGRTRIRCDAFLTGALVFLYFNSYSYKICSSFCNNLVSLQILESVEPLLALVDSPESQIKLLEHYGVSPAHYAHTIESISLLKRLTEGMAEGRPDETAPYSPCEIQASRKSLHALSLGRSASHESQLSSRLVLCEDFTNSQFMR